MRLHTAGRAGFFFASIIALSACSSGSDSDPAAFNDDAPAPEPVVSPNPPSSVNNPNPPAEPSAPPVNAPAAPANPPATPAPGVDTPPVEPTPEPEPTPAPAPEPAPTPVPNNPPANQTPVQGEVPTLVQSNLDNGITASGGDDDSPTQTESLSLVGPFLQDPDRAAGPPSVPTGLVALMKSRDWVEFSWVPSVDDQSVEGYEILRDGTPVFMLRGDTGYEFDYKSWITTSYMDCNYTRYTNCEGNQPANGSTHDYSVVAIDNEGMRSAPSAPVTISLSTPQTSAPNLTGYNLVFDQEFEGEGLDRDVWKTSLAWGPDQVVNGELQYFVNIFGNDDVNYNPFEFTGTTLKIRGIATPANELANANNQPYLSGVINSQDNFSFTYGYVEMSAKIASGSGLLSTFYLFNQSFEKNQPEIDILEYIGDRPTKAYQTYHYYDSNRSRWGTGERHSSPTMEVDTGIDLSTGFHRYSVLWEPGLVIWYIDGAEVRRIEGPRVSDEPMNIIAHLVLGSEWIGEPNAASLPATLEIDYIKAWQRP